MNRLIGQARLWLDGRTLRERRLLAIMGGMIVATALWLALVMPVLGWGERARERLDAARVQAVAVQAALAQAPRAPSVDMPPSTGMEPILTEAAARHGLSITTEMSAGGDLAFRGSDLATADVFRWLAEIRAARIVSLSVVESGPYSLVVEGVVDSGP